MNKKDSFVDYTDTVLTGLMVVWGGPILLFGLIITSPIFLVGWIVKKLTK